MRARLLAVAVAAAGLAAGCGQVSTQDDPVATTAPSDPSTTVPAATSVSSAPPTSRATVTTSAVAAAAEANRQLCSAVATADLANTGGRIEEGGTGLAAPITATEKAADAGVVAAARTMVVMAAARDVIAYADAAATASSSCARLGHPTRRPTVIGPVQCVTTPCP